MTPKKWGAVGLAALLLVGYNGAQPGLRAMRENDTDYAGTSHKERYGPSLAWLDRLIAGQNAGINPIVQERGTAKLDFKVMSSMMIAGLASGFKSQVANLLWMKSDEYWHKGLLTRQVPLMEAVVTLDPQFIDAWSTAGWHWAYNIYADLPERADLKNNPKALRKEQDICILTGLDYLDRGAAANPDTYRLWFEDGWTRSEKGGIMDERAINLFRIARQKKDARQLEKSVADATGKPKTTKVQGNDLVGRTIGHIYEKQPQIDKALNQYSIMLENGRYEATTGKASNPDSTKPLPAADEALLQEAGRYWSLYGSDYTQIVSIYRDSDSVIKSQIKKLIPDIDNMVKAQAQREKMQGYDPQPTGAYISIAARYLPAWNLQKAGKYQQAIDTLVGVMNADPKYHLSKLDVTAKVFEIRGDAPAAIKAATEAAKAYERSSSQEIGLHMLAKLYEEDSKKIADPKKKKEYAKLAYETWYRARERNSLDYYARRNSFLLEDEYGFTPPKHIIDAIKKSRKTSKGSDFNAAPAAPPNVAQYQTGA